MKNDIPITTQDEIGISKMFNRVCDEIRENMKKNAPNCWVDIHDRIVTMIECPDTIEYTPKYKLDLAVRALKKIGLNPRTSERDESFFAREALKELGE